MRKLTEITDEHALQAANIAGIRDNLFVGRNVFICRTGSGADQDSVIVKDVIKNRSLRIYFNGSNTRVMDKGFEVIEYCYEIYAFLKRKGYTWKY